MSFVVRKAVISAAGPNQAALPLQRILDRDGVEKTALQLVLAEVASAGIDQTCVVVRPGDAEAFREAAGEHAGHLEFVEQDQPRGYGDAVRRARRFTGDEPFLHLVGDHLYLSRGPRSCARQLVETATAEQCAVSAVQATRETMLPYFGTIGGRRAPRRSDLYEVTCVVEKPTPTEAEQRLAIAGLRVGHYLCFFGMHVFTPLVMEALDATCQGADRERVVTLSDALAKLAERERYLALQVVGARYNIGMKYGLWLAQLALALAGADREQVLTELVQMLAEPAA